jgi:DNA-binding transcriptional regulator PaaX
MIVDHLKAHGRSTPRELVSMLKERQVQEWETREAMSRLMSSGDIRIDRDWRLVPEP